MLVYGLTISCISVLGLAVYLGYRLFRMKRSMRRIAKDLLDMSAEPTSNRSLMFDYPDRDVEEMLTAMNRYLEEMRAQTREAATKEKRLKAEIENISHDLRTPLTAMMGYLSMLNREGFSKQDRDYYEIAMRKTRQMQELTGKFYELSRVTSESFRLELSRIDVARIVKETCLDQYALMERLNIMMELPDGPVKALGNEDALTRVVVNLLQNASRYAHKYLKVSLQVKGQNVVLAFTNDVVAEERIADPERLFDRFYVRETSRKQGGTGLGLTISRTLVEHMGGKMTVVYIDGENAEELQFAICLRG